MKRKTMAFLLSAMLAVQPASVVLAEDLLNSGNESAETIPEIEPQAAAITDDMLTDGGESQNLVGGTKETDSPQVKTGDVLTGGSVGAATPTEGNEESPHIVDRGKCGDNLDWTLDSNGLLTISGTGDMYSAPFDDILDQIKEVQVLKGVTNIGASAFGFCRGLTSVTLPDGLTSIGDSAFFGCYGLTSVTLPDGITSIGKSAFADCSGLTSITLPGKIMSIGEGAFTNCRGLTSISLPEGVTSIENYTFSNCGGLTSISLPEGIKSIGHLAFTNCRGLTSISLPEGVTSIGDNAFTNCSGLTSITLPKSLTYIGYEAFSPDLAYTVYIGTGGERYAERIGASNITRLCTEDTHKWNEFYTTDKPATCVTAGSRSIHCSNPECHAMKPGSETSIPAKGHLWDEGVITKAPTCTEPGIRTCTCERCKWTLKKEVAPTGHTYAGEITKASFTKDGIVSGVCEDCGASVQREVIPQVSDVELSHTEYTYNGTNRQPKVVLKDRTGKELKPEEYSVVYPKESKVPGTYELTITLKGNSYEGTLTKAYTVKKGNQVIGLSDMTKRIDSKTVTLKAEILQGNKTGRFGYQSSNPEVASVTSWGRVTFHKVGKVEITAMTRGSANYNSAQKTITLTVAPVPTAITKLQSQNPGKLNIQYRATPGADGYQIQYGTSPDMKGAKYAAVENAAIRSYTRTDAMSGETYYVRVRTYNVVDGERIYSNWSGIKSAEVK